jgi:hypothetical protein
MVVVEHIHAIIIIIIIMVLVEVDGDFMLVGSFQQWR